MRQFLALAAMLLLCQTAIRAQEEEKQLNVVQDITDANIQSIVRNVGQLLNKNPQQQETTIAPTATTLPAGTSQAPVANTTQPPATTKTPNYLNPIVTFSEAQKNQPYVEQAGSPGLFPSAVNNAVIGINNKNFLVGPGTSRYLVIGDWGRIGSLVNLDVPSQTDKCDSKTYGGNNDIQGGLQQQESAQLADQVCGLLGGCQAVLGTGDNFYQCGVYPNDATNRFKSDWQNIYQTPFTPNIQSLTWYNVFGNHDIVINGSVEAQIAYSNTNPKWQMKTTGGSGNYFFADLPSVAGGPNIRAFFIDANPFIASYNVSGQKYNKAYYQAHLNAAYVDAQFTWLDTQLKASTADHNLVVGHYPIFGSATQYGVDVTPAATSPYPGNFNAWQRLLQIIYANKVTTYFNGHDHTMTAGNPAQPGAPIPWDGHTTFLTSGAGSWGEPNDSCGTKGALYSGGGAGGFIIVSANATTFQSDFFTLGSLFSQCTITAFSDKTKAPIVSDNCKLGLPNSCCNAIDSSGKVMCY